MIEVTDYESYQISFSSNGGICIGRAVTRNAVMLPPHDVVKELPRFEMQTVDPISPLQLILSIVHVAFLEVQARSRSSV